MKLKTVLYVVKAVDGMNVLYYSHLSTTYDNSYHTTGRPSNRGAKKATPG
jgi:hypothetical protein